MAYDQALAARIRAVLQGVPGLEEKKMFGGVGFLIKGNMACGVHGADLIVRVGPADYAAALALPHTAPFDMTGRPMAGWIFVRPPGFASPAALEKWVQQGLEFARSLPSK